MDEKPDPRQKPGWSPKTIRVWRLMKPAITTIVLVPYVTLHAIGRSDAAGELAWLVGMVMAFWFEESRKERS